MNKNWFISQYDEVHKNLSNLEKEIEHYTQNRMSMLSDDSVLEDLKKRVKLEIDRLNKTREYERRFFNYEERK
jgi:hypothetical protein